MKINKKLITLLLPVVIGLGIGATVLVINPSTGKKLGDMIYSTGLSVEGYSYAVAKAAPSVVNIYVAKLNEDYTKPDTSSITSSASGVVIDKNGIIVTNYHVVPSGNEPNKAIWVQTNTGKLFKAFVLGCDRRTDLAVLKVESTHLQPIEFSKTDPNVGDIVLAIGNPYNLGQTVTHGIISALARSGTGLITKDKMDIRQGVQQLIQTDAPINQGNSGGALINTQGTLIGINTASFNADKTYGIGFSVPIKLARNVISQIILHGKVERGYLGISDDESNPFTLTAGVKIGYIDPQGPAFGLLKIGDVILKINDVTILDAKALIELISQSKPGRKLKLEIQRDGSVRTETVTLAEDIALIE